MYLYPLLQTMCGLYLVFDSLPWLCLCGPNTSCLSSSTVIFLPVKSNKQKTNGIEASLKKNHQNKTKMQGYGNSGWERRLKGENDWKKWRNIGSGWSTLLVISDQWLVTVCNASLSSYESPSCHKARETGPQAEANSDSTLYGLLAWAQELEKGAGCREETSHSSRKKRDQCDRHYTPRLSPQSLAKYKDRKRLVAFLLSVLCLCTESEK